MAQIIPFASTDVSWLEKYDSLSAGIHKSLQTQIKEADEILSEIKAKIDKTTKKLKSLENKFEIEEKEKRKELIDKLRSGRSRLRKLNKEIAQISHQTDKELAEKFKIQWLKWKNRFSLADYPDPPPGFVKPDPDGIGMPDYSGIYFVWENDIVVYVGRSIQISNRVRLDNHQNINKSDLLSFLPFNIDELMYAECFYIGLLKPVKNRATPGRL